MPYIPPEDRPRVDPEIQTLVDKILAFGPEGNLDGAFNYVLVRIIVKVFGRICYPTIARAVGNVVCVVLEFYRRVAAPYEDLKKEEHGEVFEP